MGASSTSIFDDDDGADWFGDFAEQPGITRIEAAFSVVLTSDDDRYLELPECGAAIAAAEVVAALNGKPHPDLYEEIESWVDSHLALLTPRLKAEALKSLEQIKHESESKDAWMDTPYASDWLEELAALEQRLR